MEETVRETLRQLNDQLSDLPYTLDLVDPATLRLLDKNARYMEHEQFQQLAANIASDGGLSSAPLCIRDHDGALLVLSGNHRVQAAIDAGVKRILVLVWRGELSKAEQIAKQLSHNAIEGKDDPVILKELWDEIGDINLKLYAGLDTELLKELAKMDFVAISEARPDYKQVVFLFLPEETDQIKALMEDIDTLFAADETVIASRRHYDEVFKLLVEVKKKYSIVNNPTALMKICELAKAQLSLP